MRMYMLITTILFIYGSYSQSTKYCPSVEWVECGVESGNCYVPALIKAASVAYGGINTDTDPPVGSWIFAEVSNQLGQNDLVFACNNANFGNSIKNYAAKGCCYKENNGASTNDDNWELLTSQNGQFTVLQPTYIRYGVNQNVQPIYQYSYKWMKGVFTCSNAGSSSGSPHWFIDIAPGNKFCWALKNSTLPASTIQCGDEKGSKSCNLDITGNGGSVQLVEYSDGKQNAVYSNIYSTDKEFSCTPDQFGNVNPNAADNFCSILNSTLFEGAEGYWSVAASCGGTACIIDEEISEGVTSTTSESCTESWTKSLSYTVSGSLSFFSFSKSKSLTKSQSETVSKTVSSSYSIHISKTCGAVCGNGTSGDWTLYQWIMTVGEYVGPDIVSFNIDTCIYICSTISTPPKCPPTYCADANCQTCNGYP